MIWYTLINPSNSRENRNAVLWVMRWRKEAVLTTLLPNISLLVQNFILCKMVEHLWILHWFLKELIITMCRCLQFHLCPKLVKTKNQSKFIGSATLNCNIWSNHNPEEHPMQTVSSSIFFISSSNKIKMYMLRYISKALLLKIPAWKEWFHLNLLKRHSLKALPCWWKQPKYWRWVGQRRRQLVLKSRFSRRNRNNNRKRRHQAVKQ